MCVKKIKNKQHQMLQKIYKSQIVFIKTVKNL